MQTPVINVNGEILSSKQAVDQAKVSVFDRAYLYGDSLYEVVRTYGGKFFLLEEHLQRLTRSAEMTRMVLHQSLDHYRQEISRTVEAFHRQPGCEKVDVYMRLIVSRGAGKIGFALSAIKTPSLYTIIVQPVEAPTPEQFQKGAHLQISSRLRLDPRALDPAIKSGNYLNCVLAFLEAASEGYDDAILCDANDQLTEGTTFNIAYIKRGIIATPPNEIGILHGITKTVLQRVAESRKIPFRIVRFPRERLYEADEIFLTGSVKEIFPVTRIDGRPVGTGTGSGKPGKITTQLAQAYKEFVRTRTT